MGTQNNIAMSKKITLLTTLTKKERKIKLSNLVKMNKVTLVEKKLPNNSKSLKHI